MRAGTSSAAVRYRTLRRPDSEGRREHNVAAPHPRLDGDLLARPRIRVTRHPPHRVPLRPPEYGIPR